MRGPAARVYLKIVRSTSRRKRLRPTRAYIRPRRARHESESHQDLRAGLRRRPQWRSPGRVRRSRERGTRDDEVLSHLLAPVSGRTARSSVRTLLPLRVAAGPRPLDVPDFGETARPRDRRLVARRGIPRGWDPRPRDAFHVRPVRATSPAGREDARHEARYRVLRVLVRRWVVRGDAGRQRDRIGVIRHLFGMGPPNAYELSDEIANLLASPLYPPGNWCDVLRERILASVQAPTDPPWPRRLPLRSPGRTAQPPLPSSWSTATKTTRF